MKIFNYDSKLLSAFNHVNTIDAIAIIVDVIAFIWVYENPYDFGYELWRIVLLGIFLYGAYEIAKIYCKHLIAQNIKRERLEITDNGINITYNEKVLFRESLKYVEIPWEKVKYSQTIDHNVTFKNTSFIGLLSYREEYKTIQIYTSDGLFKIFIENSMEATNLINSKVQPIHI